MVFRHKKTTEHHSTTDVVPSSAASKEESATLLAPSKRRGFFGRRQAANGDGTSIRSDSDGGRRRSKTPFRRRHDKPLTVEGGDGPMVVEPVVEPKFHSGMRFLSPFKKRVMREKLVDHEDTPPVTPEKLLPDEENDEGLHVKVVTVTKNSNNTPASPGGSDAGNHEQGEEVSVMSDLTDNRTYRRMNSPTAVADRDAVNAAVAARQEMTSPGGKGYATVKARMEHVVQASQTGETAASSSLDFSNAAFTTTKEVAVSETPPSEEEKKEEDPDATADPVAYFLKYMDTACTTEAVVQHCAPGGDSTTKNDTSAEPNLKQAYSFVPEWGVAPSKDERDKDEVQADLEKIAQLEQKQRSSSSSIKVEGVHENFEMVLEDLQSTEQKLNQRRRLFGRGAGAALVEEEKKEDDEGDIKHSGARKMGKRLLKSIRRLKKLKGDLAPVSEDAELQVDGVEVAASSTSRVPSSTNRTLESDSVGEDVVQDIYNDLEASADPAEAAKWQRSPKKDKDMPPVEEESNTNMLTSFMSMFGGGNHEDSLRPELQKIPEQGSIPRSKSWAEQLVSAISEDSNEDRELSPAEKQAALAYVNANTIDQTPPRRPKPTWREAKDPTTGRSYYYHRKTREVTWRKPQELVDYEENQARLAADDGDEQLRILSVASDGDLAFAAERSGKSKVGAPMRKRDARDFDPKVWSTKEEIVKLLETMEPPDGSSVEEILKKYEGREAMLLRQLKEMKEGRPFDEPVETDKSMNTPQRSKSSPRMRRLPSLRRSPLAKNDKKADPRGSVYMSGKASGGRGMDPPVDDRKTPLKEESKPEASKSSTQTRNVARAMRARLNKRRAANAAKSKKANSSSSAVSSTLETVSESFDGEELAEASSPAKRTIEDESSSYHKSETSPVRSVDSPKTPVGMGGRSRTYGSGVASRVSEKTEVVKNTAKGRSKLNTVGELQSVVSDHTSLSSRGMEPHVEPPSTPSSSAPIPGKILAPRTRELMVEEFSTTDKSYRAEVYDRKRTVRAGRFGTTGIRSRPFTSPSNVPRHNDDSTRGSDSVSALSLEDSKRSAQTDDARRKALDQAIANEDWELAAKLSGAMGTLKSKPVRRQQPPAEWKQSELDRFISENDWGAVASYISHMRSASAGNPEDKKEESIMTPRSKTSRRRMITSPSDEFGEEDLSGSFRKRFGAKSQLQHNEIGSESSWDSEENSSYSSGEYSSSSYSEPSRGKYRYASKHSRPRPKEFAC